MANAKISDLTAANLPPDAASLLEIAQPNGSSYDSARISVLDMLGSYRRVVPTSGGTVTLSANDAILIIDPAASIATLTVTMAAPADKKQVRIVARKTISALTINGGTVDWTAGDELPAQGELDFIYILALSRWVRAGFPLALALSSLTVRDLSTTDPIVEVVGTGASGAMVKITGDGAVTPSKTMSVQAGTLHVYDDSGAQEILALSDSGNFSVLGSIGGGTSGGSFTTLIASGAVTFNGGGTVAGLTGLAIRDTSAAFDVAFAATSSPALTAGRSVTFNVGDVAHVLSLGTVANTVSFPSTSDYTLIGDGDTGTVTDAMLAGSIQTSKIIGTTTNDNAAAGELGEYSSSIVLVGSALPLATGTPLNVTSLTLAAGDWEVWGEVWYALDASTVATVAQAAINIVSATLPTAPADGTALAKITGTQATGDGDVVNVGPARLSLAGTTSVYLVAQAAFSASTASAYGCLRARRIR